MLIRLMKINTGCKNCLHYWSALVVILFLLHSLNVCMDLEIYIEESIR